MHRFINQKKESEMIPVAEPVNILIVDDLPEKLLAYKSVLDELKQNIFTVQTGEEALKMVLRYDFAVILLDVNMPSIDGIETAELIRQRRKSAHTPIIFLTAFADEISMAQGYASGAVDYLLTPVVPDVLKAKVKVFIELTQMRRQATLQAEEHAMRKAAEKSARNHAFLVNVSEVFARAQCKTDIIHSLVELPVPYFANSSAVITLDIQTGQLKALGINMQGVVNFNVLELPQPFASMEREIRHTLEQGASLIVNKPKRTDLEKKSQYNDDTYCCAVLVPLVIRKHINIVFVLALRDSDRADPETNLALANALISRAKIALENAILVEKIRESDRRKDEFLAILAHELRNPLAPIRNAVSILKLSSDMSIRTQAEQTIERQIEHMVHLIDDLMDVARITQGKIDLRKQPMKLYEAINHAIETSEPLIRKHNHKLIVDMPQTQVWLDADFGRMSQIFSNLLNNAAKYTNNNGVIELTVRAAVSSVTITVRDNGIGIPEHMLQRIFDVFSQVDSSLERSQGGLGIGLTLVRKLIEMHGGAIEVSSQGVNSGSEFTVTLPTLTVEEEEAVEMLEETETVTDRKLKVLMVDDSEAAAKTMGLMIELLGHEVKLAYDGPSAIEHARHYEPDVILLDIGLPGMNGYEACRIMKQEAKLKNTLFIAQTGWGQSEHRQMSHDAGFDHHLVKPVSMESLNDILSNYSTEAIVASLRSEPIEPSQIEMIGK